MDGPPEYRFELHDDELVELVFNWEAGRLELRLVVGGEKGRLPLKVDAASSVSAILDLGLAREAVLLALGVTSLVVPREHPWGPSLYINEARVLPLSDELGKLELRMGSGDVIQVVAREFRLELGELL